jgi:hypothetical protein
MIHLSWLWFAIGAGIVVLAALVGYGNLMWRTRQRDPQIEGMRDNATQRNYDEAAE